MSNKPLPKNSVSMPMSNKNVPPIRWPFAKPTMATTKQTTSKPQTTMTIA